MKAKKNELFIIVGCIFILCIYFGYILYINLSGDPTFYLTDMYSDIIYAAEAWSQKNIFPNGWVFGNQFYTVATPVLAAIFYGLFHDHCLAMGIASSFMGICTLLSLNWMLKPVQKNISVRLVTITTFISLVLFSGGPIYGDNGWQLFFTMCSYYSCYAITVFLAVGCYLRSDHIFERRSIVVFIITCVLSFATGLQSLRQTLIMVCPLLALEFFKIIYQLIRKIKISLKSVIVSFSITFFNILGVIFSKIINVDQIEIFGKTELINTSEFISSVIKSISNAISLFFNYNRKVSVALIVFILISSIFTIIKLKSNPKSKATVCIIFFTFSLLCVLFIDILTSMNIRRIYYFLGFPLAAIFVGFLYLYSKGKFKCVSIAFLSGLFMLNVIFVLYPLDVFSDKTTSYTEVIECLKENNVTTIYSQWNLGEKIAIASDCEIQAGFWDSVDNTFQSVKYLCNPEIFDAPPENCAYIFKGKEAVDAAKEIAQINKFDFTLVKHFAESDIYIFISEAPIMQLMDSMETSQ